MEEKIEGTGPPPVAWPPPPPVVTPSGPPATTAPIGSLNPWVSIWTQPRATLRQILDANPRRLVIPLALLSGVAGGLAVATLPQLPAALPREATAAAALLFLPLISLLGLYVGGFLLRVTGGWLEGRADAVAVRAALAWSSVAGLWIVALFTIPQNLLLGLLDGEALDLADLLAHPGPLLIRMILGVVGLGLGICQLVIKMKCLGEAFRFSAWRALGAYVLAWLLVLAVPATLVVAGVVAVFLLRAT